MGLDGRFKSLSARRAWIEIFLMYHCICKEVVALRKESVDRNIWVDKTQSAPRMSLSARRAWIEILGTFTISQSVSSLSARRAWIEISTVLYLTR